jgi:hypothetical protein
MKTILSIIAIIIFPLRYDAQTNDESTQTVLECDTLVLSSGDTMTCLVQELKKRKIIYFICCDVCAVPREIKRALVDSIILSNASKKRLHLPLASQSKSSSDKNKVTEQIVHDSIPHLAIDTVLMLKKKFGNQKEFIIRKGTKLTVFDSKGFKYKGKVQIVSLYQMNVGENTINLNDVSSISMHYKGTKIVGGILGGATTLLTFYLSWFSGFDEPITAFIPASASLFSIMAIKRKFDLVEKFDLYILH